MDRLLILGVGAVFLLGGLYISKKALFDDVANQSMEAVAVGVLGAAVGFFLCWVGIFGPPDY